MQGSQHRSFHREILYIVYMYHCNLIERTLPLVTEIVQEFIFARKIQNSIFFQCPRGVHNMQDFPVKRPLLGSLQLEDEIRIRHTWVWWGI